MFHINMREKTTLVTPKEVMIKIIDVINPKKASCFDLVRGEILKQMPRNATITLIDSEVIMARVTASRNIKTKLLLRG